MFLHVLLNIGLNFLVVYNLCVNPAVAPNQINHSSIISYFQIHFVALQKCLAKQPIITH